MPLSRLGQVGLALVLAGILFLALRPSSQGVSRPGEESVRTYEEEISSALSRVLSQVQGAGRVEARVFLEEGPVRLYARENERRQNRAEESLPGGGARTSQEATSSARVVTVAGSGGQQPLVEGIRQPTVRGVLVVAPGAVDENVRLELARAVEALLDVPLHRVEILPGKEVRR